MQFIFNAAPLISISSCWKTCRGERCLVTWSVDTCAQGVIILSRLARQMPPSKVNTVYKDEKCLQK